MQATYRPSVAQREALARQEAPFLAAGLIAGNFERVLALIADRDGPTL